MNTGKLVRLNRLFSHSSGRLCSVAVDHFVGYSFATLPDGLRNIKPTLEQIVAGKPDAVTMQKGLASSAWQPYAGRVPMIMQTSGITVDDVSTEQIGTPEDAVRLGADAVAVAAFVRGDSQGYHLGTIAEVVRQAAVWDIPVICHIYPRVFDPEPAISFEPEDIAWAVRCAFECGADVVKVPFCHDIEAYRQIVDDCPVPVVAAGGPKTSTMLEALQSLANVVASGARGATIGRNVWGNETITKNVLAVKAVIHDGMSAESAMCHAGL